MRIDILTLFPDIFENFLKASLLGKAISKGILKVKVHDLRSFCADKQKTADDKPFGGGCGMVMKIEPIYRALKKLKALKKNRNGKKPFVVLMSPQGSVFSQKTARAISTKRNIVLICGHYEGVDERISNFIDCEISIGDYVLNGGEVPAMAVIESVARLLKGFAKEKESVVNDSFYNGLLDWPCYTRPRDFLGYKVPDVLLSGNHKKIADWRKKKAFENTKKKKPYLIRSLTKR